MSVAYCNQVEGVARGCRGCLMGCITANEFLPEILAVGNAITPSQFLQQITEPPELKFSKT